MAKEIWICEKQTVTKWEGDILSYKDTLKKKVMKEISKDAKSKFYLIDFSILDIKWIYALNTYFLGMGAILQSFLLYTLKHIFFVRSGIPLIY